MRIATIRRAGPSSWAGMHKLATAAEDHLIDIVADLASGYRGLKKRPKGGSDALLE